MIKTKYSGACAVIALLLLLYSPDHLKAGEHVMQLSPKWEYVSDQVMGGVSEGAIHLERTENREIARLTGDVSLENNGGFVQMAFDLKRDGAAFDASSWRGIELEIKGNSETYDVRLRTTELSRPWQSFRTQVTAQPDLEWVRLPFASFVGHRTTAPFNPAQLRRIGVLAIGRVFEADVTVAGVRFYR